MSSPTKLEIMNMALGFLGTRMISAVDENSPEATQCNLYWDRARRSTLRDYPYHRAMCRIVLTEKTMPDAYADDWAFCYALPDTALKVLQVHDGRPRMNKTPYHIAQGDTGGIILTDVGDAVADIVVDVETISLWDELFIGLMARKLACQIAIPLLKNNPSKVQEVESLYRAALQDARGIDASEAYDRQEEDSWILARETWG